MQLCLNFKEFQAISIEECLNYTPHLQLENNIQNKVKNSIKNLKYSNLWALPAESKLRFLLEQVLLKTATTDIWIRYKTRYNLDQKYLYTIIKKYLYINLPELFV